MSHESTPDGDSQAVHGQQRRKAERRVPRRLEALQANRTAAHRVRIPITQKEIFCKNNKQLKNQTLLVDDFILWIFWCYREDKLLTSQGDHYGIDEIARPATNGSVQDGSGTARDSNGSATGRTSRGSQGTRQSLIGSRENSMAGSHRSLVSQESQRSRTSSLSKTIPLEVAVEQ